MKILLVYASTYPWDVRVEKMATWLGERGHEVHLLCANHDCRPEFEQIGLLAVHRLRRLPAAIRPLQTVLGLPSPLNPTWLLAARTRLLRERPDVVVVRDLHVALAATAAAHAVGVPVVLDLAENWPSILREWRKQERWSLQNLLFRHPAGSRVIERIAVHRADHVVVVVDEMKVRLVRDLGVPPSRVTVVTNTPRRRSLRAPIGTAPEYTLVYFGMVHRDHGLETAILAVAAARAEGPCGAAARDRTSEAGSMPLLPDPRRFVRTERFRRVPRLGSYTRRCLSPCRGGARRTLPVPCLRAPQHDHYEQDVRVHDDRPAGAVLRR